MEIRDPWGKLDFALVTHGCMLTSSLDLDLREVNV